MEGGTFSLPTEGKVPGKKKVLSTRAKPTTKKLGNWGGMREHGVRPKNLTEKYNSFPLKKLDSKGGSLRGVAKAIRRG